MGKRHDKPMIRATLNCLLAVTFALPLSGCLTQRTVSEGGHTVSQEYVIKRPLKEAVHNSQ
jgi:hypothetical protein